MKNIKDMNLGELREYYAGLCLDMDEISESQERNRLGKRMLEVEEEISIRFGGGLNDICK